ncbi:MAG: hypothetical protein M3P18_01500 [Actinomycetota bacterium]|nr:hypothetical protein [Actinomycetota bacterium]
MRNINAWMFVTLDGVMEAPEEWVIADDEMFAAMEAREEHRRYAPVQERRHLAHLPALRIPDPE